MSRECCRDDDAGAGAGAGDNVEEDDAPREKGGSAACAAASSARLKKGWGGMGEACTAARLPRRVLCQGGIGEGGAGVERGAEPELDPGPEPRAKEPKVRGGVSVDGGNCMAC